MGFPTIRLRRLRRTEPLRRLARETELAAADLIYPLFVCPGKGVRKEISSMPGNYRLFSGSARRGMSRGGRSRNPGRDSLRDPEPKGRKGVGGL